MHTTNTTDTHTLKHSDRTLNAAINYARVLVRHRNVPLATGTRAYLPCHRANIAETTGDCMMSHLSYARAARAIDQKVQGHRPQKIAEETRKRERERQQKVWIIVCDQNRVSFRNKDCMEVKKYLKLMMNYVDDNVDVSKDFYVHHCFRSIAKNDINV